MASTIRRLRLGSRGSPLALAQSHLVINALRATHQGLATEVVTFETQGDRDRDTPLSQVTDADFFSDALDRALLERQIDFTVHSMKDLGAERPAGICRAAIPVRENPRDVVLFRSDVLDRLRSGTTLRIGTSSLRRRANVNSFLVDALPRFGGLPNLQFVALRGPVDERVSRLSVDAGDPIALDGAVLALAGLERLWREQNGRRALQAHLEKARWMVLPLSECPAAPGQGALAIECNQNDLDTRQILAALHDPTTESLVQQEMDAAATVAESQRAEFGATAINHSRLGPLLFRRGPEMSAKCINWNHPQRPDTTVGWDSAEWFGGRRREAVKYRFQPAADQAVFVAHWTAAVDELEKSLSRVWVSGVTSWHELAKRGIWVEGCAENLGFEHIVPTLTSKVLGLPPIADWTVLTRRGAEDSWRASGDQPDHRYVLSRRADPLRTQSNA